MAVSVAWDYGTSKHTVDSIMEQEMEEDDVHLEGPPEETSLLGKAEAWATTQVLNAWHVHLEQHHVSTEEVKSLLVSMCTAACAFVIFPDQESKSRAVKAVETSGVAVNNVACKLKPCHYAPEGLFWHNMGVTPEQRTKKIFMALLAPWTEAQRWCRHTVATLLPGFGGVLCHLDLHPLHPLRPVHGFIQLRERRRARRVLRGPLHLRLRFI